jgi:hypothetical protein
MRAFHATGFARDASTSTALGEPGPRRHEQRGYRISRGLGQLREILVGAVQRDIERRLTRAESSACARLSEVQQESSEQRVAKIEEGVARVQHELRHCWSSSSVWAEVNVEAVIRCR